MVRANAWLALRRDPRVAERAGGPVVVRVAEAEPASHPPTGCAVPLPRNGPARAVVRYPAVRPSRERGEPTVIRVAAAWPRSACVG